MTTKKLRLTDDYQHESEEEEQQQTSKKEPPMKPTKTDVNEMYELITREKQAETENCLKVILNFKC